ncbi:bidirectional NAD-reducing hydrogenase subunit HoxH (plasmid) [Cupriavidus necator H16]|uniref:NAD-reducing hydrogenase HoxS subunit beta n=2 Tax=Cupriavidus necator (strain ATCC 17699 / DSM 428 / KCTC 22496 / NCIMB 10442 / H16 / Stanier 337) TaxID=381666 RepID=HOXH_CUPNH|nr:bidirectional NAD-reducing hydrogenase subunit HoxH [Cupriavidus necator]P22320.3 RecName: Full=NAD-reducing hydrogenase HoxS subunit beta [Cupriavidus necator H16]AAP85844.1 NAD-reducing hydrogenase hydrogenase moiety large subunit [Cupriavidus necator H16]QCC05350.1 NAD-reducing hydrogenase HoxS subunit beta [Cupriavidus necator H16]QQB81520.1 bidirectional NAD-reducing hydrogenase subunit HoxH [Cupriavidus necator]
MSRKLVIDPVTRIEGHGKVVVHLDDDNKVVDAKLHVVEFRGFEKFVQGHPFWEAPMFLQRICGICFVSHHLCGAKALDDMVGVGLKSGIHVTPTAEKMRRLGHYAQMLQSHTTAYFYLIVPEMLFGMDAPPAQRNVLGLIEANPDLVKRVVMLRKWGQEVIKAVFGKKMHGINSVPGGVNNNLSIAERDRFLNGEEGLLSVDQVIDYAQDGLRLFYDFHQKHRAQVDSFADVPALSMCLVGDDDNVDYYHGRLRIIDDDKHIVREFDYHDYLDHFSEAVEEWSYMKFPYLKELGREQGSVRVGPLGRMNVTKSLPTPLAQEALERFHAYTKGRTNNMTLHTNWARAIEILHAAEVVKELLHDPDLQKDQLVLTPPPNAWTGEGVGVVEAPRGTLLHHYRADERGNITFANLVVATTQNNQVMNRTVRSVAEDYLGGHGEITEGMMNAIEVGIRAYDPCLSCATHALGQMPLVVSVFDAAGRLIDERAR